MQLAVVRMVGPDEPPAAARAFIGDSEYREDQRLTEHGVLLLCLLLGLGAAVSPEHTPAVVEKFGGRHVFVIERDGDQKGHGLHGAPVSEQMLAGVHFERYRRTVAAEFR